MSSGHRLLTDLLQATLQGGAKIPDPGTGKTVSLQKNFGNCPLTIAAAGETRALPSPTASTSNVGVGTRITFVADEITNSGTVTFSGTSRSVTLANEGDFVTYEVQQYNSTKAWVPIVGKVQETIQLNPEGWRVWDAMQTNLPGTAASDDLGLSTGTFGSATNFLAGVDYGGTSTTAYARRTLAVPTDYVAGTSLSLLLDAVMVVVSDNSASVDVEVFPTVNGDNTIGSDICATAAQSVNSATQATKTFSLTGTDLTGGVLLDIRLKHTGTDAGNAQNNINVQIRNVRLTYTRRL